jgi:photosystem II stability/assembly factor-like uncharacterized protein
LATLPLAQLPSAPTPGEAALPKPSRRILAAEYAPSVQNTEPPAPRVQPDDARLADVCSVDPQHGWAVGDFGLILHTDDGGQDWSPQVSGVTCTLASICFVDARCGWAAGGMAYPYLHDSSGVVLSTRDGGLSWQREPVLLPALRKIRFLTQRQGWAVGCPSAMFPGGVFITRDAGRSWQPACSGGTSRLTTGDFFDGRNAILGGSLGLMAALSEGDFSRNPHSDVILHGVHGMQVVPPAYGWLVGDGGWIALTGNRGDSWRPPLGPLPHGAALFDFSALAVRGPKCWVAGSPGSRVFFTPDAGRTWSAFPTGTTLPLRAISFVDDLHGWAVGQLGLILRSNDGGRTWRRQRSGGARAAVMAVAGVPQDLPLELLARICKEEGHLGVAEVLGRVDLQASPRGDVPAADRLHQAMLRVGACAGETAWGFPIRQPDLLLPAEAIREGWNRVHNGHGGDALLAHVARQIRTWRPSVVLIPGGRNTEGLGQLVEQSVAAAVKLAGDPAFLADQFGLAGCEPWKVQRVYLVSDTNSPLPLGEGQGVRAPGKVALAADDWSSRLGQTWADAALPARTLLDDYQSSPGLASVQLIETYSSRGPGEPAARVMDVDDPRNRFDIMSGLASIDGPSRRPVTEADSTFGGPLDGLALGRQVQMVFEHVQHDPQAAFARLAKGGELPPGIDASAAAVLTFRIAERFQRTGRWDLADKTLALLIERYPFDPLARWALAWRLQILAASEIPAAEGEGRAEQALRLAREIEVNQPDLFASPAVRYPLGAVYRQVGQDSKAQRLYDLDHRGVDRDAWWSCARGELWLSERKGPPPKQFARCVSVKDRPHLDGRLDEALWKKCSPIVLSSPLGDDRAWPATVRLAHDEQYLYLAIQCRQAPGARYEATRERRPRDPDLSRHDRVDIFLDLDRDYATYYHLTIDHRGWAADARCGDRSWNPKWFIAAQTTDGVWTAEAAMPLAELRATIVPGKTIWAVGLQRTVPGVGFQSWTMPADTAVAPEGFGWLGFE